MNKFIKYAPILLLVFSFLAKDALCQSNYDPTDEVIDRHINNPTDTVLLLKRISGHRPDGRLSKLCSDRFVNSSKFKRLRSLLSSNLSLAFMQEARLQTFYAGRKNNKVFLAFVRRYDDNQLWYFSHYFTNARDIRDGEALSQIPLKPFAEQSHFADFIPHFKTEIPNLQATDDVSVIFDNLVVYTPKKVKNLFYVVVKYFRPNLRRKSYKNGWLLVDFGYTSKKPDKYRTVFDEIPDIKNLQPSQLELSNEPVTLTSGVRFHQEQSHTIEPSSKDSRKSHGMKIKLNRPIPRSLKCHNYVKSTIGRIFTSNYVRIAIDFVNFLPGSSNFDLKNFAKNLEYFHRYRIDLDSTFLSQQKSVFGNCDFLRFPHLGNGYFEVDISRLDKQIKKVEFGMTTQFSYIDFYY
jgi:hypothetical protein